MSNIQTTTRRVGLLHAAYFSVEPDRTDPTGERMVSVVRHADKGDLIELTASEEKRLDDLGALDEPGVSDGDRKEADQAKLDQYRAQRGDRDAVARAVERAVAPTVAPQGPPDPPEHVSPPGGGSEPRGTYTKGDRGGPDTQPVGGIAPPAGGMVRADAPDVAVASPAELAAWIVEAKPNAGDTVALAEGDPVLAAKVLEAEGIATGGDPRQSVAKPLSALAPESPVV